MKLIGVTGGVGSGKSEILRYIKEHYNCRVLLSDDAARWLEMPGHALYDQLVPLLSQYPGSGAPLLQPDGAIVWKEMAARIFRNPDLLQKVNALVHPAVGRYIWEQIEREKARGEIDYFFLEAALLIECGYRDVVDEMWYIYCDPAVRRQRLKASRGYSDEKIDRIMSSQLSDEEFRRSCDIIIDNSGDLKKTYAQIDAALG
ncbi:MAG: dephospho-CoA kinase [Lachnospiraceae bacterium]|nr:dephospho-CoA kinase [Lachnospiraceae bacterium]